MMLIDLTDERFKTDENRDVINFIARTNPFAHSDLGMRLLKLAEGLVACHDYSPNYPSCAYVVLHNDRNKIFAIAYGMEGLAFRLPPDLVKSAQSAGANPAPDIGPDWVTFYPWPVDELTAVTMERLHHWCKLACDASNS